MTPRRPVKIPGPDHPIAIAPSQSRIVIFAEGREIANTIRALYLEEAQYPPILYILRSDIDMMTLRRSVRRT